MITGKTTLIAHLGYPTENFKAPMIYNPWFAKHGIDAVVVPMGVRANDYPTVMKSVFKMTNVRGALITMPHKVVTLGLLDEASTAVQVAGSCNAVLKRPDGKLFGDMFDGTGFVRGLRKNGFNCQGARCLVVGNGGVGSAIAASLAAAGAASLSLFDLDVAIADGLATRLRKHFPKMEVKLATNDPAGYDLLVNGTPMGMNPGDPLPVDPSRLSPSTFVGEVVMKSEITPLLHAARERGCRFQVGSEMLFEMIPAYLEFFGFGSATTAELRVLGAVEY
jgi:shikimate dehydrogenase